MKKETDAIEFLEKHLAMKILLTDEEINEVHEQWCDYVLYAGANDNDYENMLAKAQLKKVVGWLEEYNYGDAPTPVQVVNWIKQALLKEVE